jgi:hypothetical protein
VARIDKVDREQLEAATLKLRQHRGDLRRLIGESDPEAAVELLRSINKLEYFLDAALDGNFSNPKGPKGIGAEE